MPCTSGQIEVVGGQCLDVASLAKTSALENCALTADMDVFYFIVMGGMVFLMQLGFTMLEVGCVRARSVENILFKNLIDACLGAVVWLTIGWMLSSGVKENPDGFAGSTDWAIHDTQNFRDFFFSWCFAATAATIVSGAVAERITLHGYLCYSVVITGFIYPVVVYWVWSGGWMTFGSENSMGIMDFAGSGVVHMVGGFSGLMGAAVVGKRRGAVEQHSVPFIVFGTLILWFGWYGFNCGSTLGISGLGSLAARVAVNTTFGAASAGLTVVVTGKVIYGKYSAALMCNGILAGLVSITANCHVIDIGYAIIIGVIGGMVYVGGSFFVQVCLDVDDVLDACAVHGFSGMWGVIATGFFYNEDLVKEAYSTLPSDFSRSDQIGKQIFGAFVIMTWTVVLAGGMFMLLKLTVGLQISEDDEEKGMDNVEHMGRAWNHRKESIAELLIPAKKPQEIAMESPIKKMSAESPKPAVGGRKISEEEPVSIENEIQFEALSSSSPKPKIISIDADSNDPMDTFSEPALNGAATCGDTLQFDSSPWTNRYFGGNDEANKI